jgi:uncharacterized protein YjbI with pentapeptide repeats
MSCDTSQRQLVAAHAQVIFSPGKENDLKLGCDIVRKEFNGLHLSGCSLENSYFRDSYFKETNFKNANMDYTDFENVIFDGCTFDSCTFGSDIRSSVFLNCTFINSNIDESFIDGCTFKDSIIKNSTIDVTSITNCTFDYCLLENMYLKTASLYHTIFRNCRWVELDWSFVTIFYIVLINCIFKDVTLALPTLDYIFGLREENFKGINLKKYRRKEVKSLKKPLEAWKKYENMRSKNLSILTKGFCIKEKSMIFVFKSFLLNLPKKRNSCPYIGRDEILFLQNVLTTLEEERDLSVFALILIIEWAFETLNQINLKGDSADVLYIQPTLIQLYTRLHQIFQEKLYFFENQRLFFEQFSADQEVIAKFVFHDRPRLSVSKVLNELADISGLEISAKTQFISSKEGSYVEIVKTTLFTLFAIQTFLYLLNGIVIKLTELKARYKILKQKELPKHFHDLSITGKQPVSPALQKILKNFFNKSAGLEILENIDFFGYNKGNIENIDLSDVYR